MRKLIGFLLPLVALVFGFELMVTQAVRAGLAWAGETVLGVPVTIELAWLEPLTGRAGVRGLVVGSPEGFSSPHSMRFGSIEAEVDPRTILKRKIVFRRILIDSPEIVYEGGMGGSNFSRLQRKAERFAGGSEPSSRDGRRVQIDRLSVRNGKVMLTAKLLGGAGLGVGLSDIEVEGIGRGKEGATAAEAADAFLKALGPGVAKAVARSGGAVGRGLSAALKSVGGGVRKALGGLKKAFRKPNH